MVRNAKRERKRLEYELGVQSKIQRTHDPGPGLWHIGEDVLVAVPSSPHSQKTVKLGDPSLIRPPSSGSHDATQPEDRADDLLSAPPRKMARIEGKLGAADPIMPTEQRVSMTTNIEPLRRSDLSAETKTVMAVGVPCMQALGQALGQHHRPLLHEQQKRENDQLLPRPAVLVHESSSMKKGSQKSPEGLLDTLS
ncbi:uncharacterized protein K441DRAFT_674226 [Cenococcum geophilum 1.58]|uniref:uncharacterized protein n=1 Tax=Cenococcum geophilum 1.58 TaxID=794803 RepID=UPI00358EEFEB|nr:hypothetical protein K441DRAFT_674226 [Cenococcum geophilum 1.58]